MKLFANLIRKLDSTNKTTAKVAALIDYFKVAPDSDKVWAIAILSHRRPPRPVNTTLIRSWAAQLADIPLWLFEDSYHIVGDLAETIALIIPASHEKNEKSLSRFVEDIIALKNWSEQEKKEYLLDNWSKLPYYERFIFTKLITGSLRIGISRKLMTRALSVATNIEEDVLAYRLMGNWDPSTTTFYNLVIEQRKTDLVSKPYPFYLAYPLEGVVEDLGEVSDWFIEHKWDGIRAQIIVRNHEVFVWSRGEELVTDKYPEFHPMPGIIPNGTVLDGEILAFPRGNIGSFNDLQTRIGRKNITKKLLNDTPVIIKAYDLLEWQGKDIRNSPLEKRRKLLEGLWNIDGIGELPIHLSEISQVKNWKEVAAERSKARENRSEGLMLKRKSATYRVGRKKGDWWKWKVDPLRIDAVLTYAMRGHGRRTNLFTDYTFALWDKELGELVTFAKAYSGLTDAEFRKVDAWIKRNTLERFGPVRSVTPQLVFEIAFEGVALSKRHKSGVATRFPRIVRWRQDKKAEEANTLEDLKKMIPIPNLS